MERYVLLTLPGPPGWEERLRQCLASGAVAAELTRCASIEELHVRLTSGRRHSAVVVAAPLPLDSPLALPSVVLTRDFSLVDLLSGLARAGAIPVPSRDRLTLSHPAPPQSDGRAGGLLLAVCGPGGTGASTVAMALAHGLEDAVLADFALRADQLVLHAMPAGARWGLFEFLERPRFPDLPRIPGRPYRLLPGLRRPSHWTLVRPAAFDRALDLLRSTFETVVADITGDFDGTDETGSIDIEERNHMARRVASLADVVFVVGGPGEKGRHALGCVVDALLALGVSPSRVVRVGNGAPSCGDVCLPVVEGPDVAPALTPLLLPFVDGLTLAPPVLEPVRVVPGSLGSW